MTEVPTSAVHTLVEATAEQFTSPEQAIALDFGLQWAKAEKALPPDLCIWSLAHERMDADTFGDWVLTAGSRDPANTDQPITTRGVSQGDALRALVARFEQ